MSGKPSIITWIIWLLLLVLTPGTSPLKGRPAGIRNEGNYCYMAAILQNIFHLPTIRKAVLESAPRPEEEEKLATQALFRRLESSRDQVASLQEDFFPAFQASVDRWGIPLEPGNPDDSQVFYDWLVQWALPKQVETDLLSTTMVTKRSFKGITYQTVREREPLVRLTLNPNRPTSLASWLNEGPTEIIENVMISPTGNGELDQKLINAGVKFGSSVNSITQTYELESAGPILPIMVVKNWLESHNRNLDLAYDSIITVNGIPYEFNGVVRYVPGHYYAQARDGGIADAWYTLNDSQVQSIPQSEALAQGKLAYMLFYVKKQVASTKGHQIVKPASPGTSSEPTSNTTIIVLPIIGGTLLIIIITVTIVIVRRIRRRRQEVQEIL